MTDTLLYNDGLDLLKQFLDKWFKENNITENHGNYKMFLPKIYEDKAELIFAFPIYTLEDGKYKLISWLEFNASKNAPKSIDLDIHNIYNDKIIMFDFEANKNLVAAYYNIFFLEINVNRTKKYQDVYDSQKEVIKTKIEEYNNLLKELRFEEYETSFEKEENIPENFSKEVKENVEKADIKIENSSKTLNQRDDICTFSYATKMLATHNSERKQYDFDWKNENKLRFVSDRTLELAYKIIKYGKLKLSIENENKIKIESYIMGLCDAEVTTDELNGEFINSDSVLKKYKIVSDRANTFTCSLTNLERVCEMCKFEKCPKMYAAYILYLYNNGLLKQCLEDREKYRKENEYNDYYCFVWKNKDGLKKVSKNIFDFASAICDKNGIWVGRKLFNNEIKIYSYHGCQEYRKLNNVIEDIDEDEIIKRKKDNKYTTISRKINSDLGVCKAYSNCRLGGCPFVVAGYIQYLRISGKEQQIIDDRKYYEEHKEEIEAEIQESLKKELQKEEENQKIYTRDFDDYKDDLENIDDLFEMLDNPYQKSFHCAISCKDIKEREAFAEKIKNELINQKKLTHKHKGKVYTNISLRNFVARTLYFETKYIKAYPGDTDTIKDGAIEYACDKNGKALHIKDGIVCLEILKNHLYIIDGISEFIRDYRYFKTLNSDNVYRKQAERTLDILTNLDDNNYLILLGTENEIDSLFSLDNRFKFAYQDSLFKIKEMTIDEMFNRYIGLVKSEFLEEIRENKEIVKKKFESYISLNKEFIPLSNREIVNYLANYTNKKDKLELPDNIYKKETVDEALKNIIGLDSVKSKLKDFEKYMLFQLKAKANDMKIKSSNMHMIFTGNPGTGKTTVARIMAKMLYDLGMLRENKLVEVERKDLIGKYIGQTAPKTSEVIERAMGGVLFIDEAYSLTQSDSPRDYGAEAIATLIKAMEDKKDQFVVIFAGYKDEMKTFVDSNPGIASRIGYTFDFPDYSPDELVQIFNLKMKNSGFELENDIEPHLKNICEYFSKRKAFGNGRFIDKLIQETIINHSLKENTKINLIKMDDIPTMEQLANTSADYNSKDLKVQLQNVVGMENIKEKLMCFEKLVSFNKRAINEGIEIPSMNMHMMFTGNPGTGKTMIARIIAKMLFDIGVIHENKLIETERKDFIGQYQGETTKKTNEIIEKAMGGVLFIDEAYSLTEGKDSLGKEAIATLIKAMEDKKDQFIVIFAGYRDEMKTFMDSNSGIASRIGYTFEFKDYIPEELLEIFKRKITKAGFEYENGIEKELLNIFEYFSKRKAFGNGRFVDKLIQEIILKHTMNEHENIRLITLDDIPTIVELNPSRNDSNIDAQKALDSVIGLKDLKEKVKEFTAYIKFIKDAQNEGINVPSNNMHMIFTGNPGTGKTMIARIMAKLFFDMGFIHENKLVEVERKDLVGEYVGHTAPKTAEAIEKAMGGVLFIDEAYSLAQGHNSTHDFGAEAIATLIKAMEDHKGEFIVIFAGYQKEMKDFLNVNPGIASRIGYTFDFNDYSAAELEEIYYSKIQKLGFNIVEEAKVKIRELMQYFESVENIGNGRFVDKVLQNTLMKMAKNRKDDLSKVYEEHIPTIKEMTSTLLGGNNMIDPTKITQESLRKTAAHEVGHATIAYLLNKKPGIKKITVKAEGRGTLGYVRFEENEENVIYRKSYLLNKIKELMAGMITEDVYFGEHANGNTSDLERATNIAYNMITKYGMSDLGYAQVSNPQGEVAKLVFEEQNKIMKNCYDETYALIKKYKPCMDCVVEFLLEKGDITEEEFITEFNKAKPNEDEKKPVISANSWSMEPPKTNE